jgi:hypothetical protein
LLLTLSAAACAIPPAPQVAAAPLPGQARIWFYRLWDPIQVRIHLPPAASLLRTDFRIMVGADALNAGGI